MDVEWGLVHRVPNRTSAVQFPLSPFTKHYARNQQKKYYFSFKYPPVVGQISWAGASFR
jgi:hypothetical protein